MKIKLLLQLSLACLVCATAGCDRYGDLCERQVDCLDGNDADVDACVVDAEEQEEHASLWDCDEYFDALVDCYDEKADCEDVGDQKIFTAEDKCEDEEKDYAACI